MDKDQRNQFNPDVCRPWKTFYLLYYNANIRDLLDYQLYFDLNCLQSTLGSFFFFTKQNFLC